MVDWRDARIAELERQLAERDARIAELERRSAHLEELLRRSSKSSSKPPSSDGPKKAKRAHQPTGRKPGGQPGHPKHERPLAPPDKVNERVVVKPPSCERCERALSGCDAAPRLHHVWELPPVEPHVTEYRLHALACRGCGRVTRAALPAGVPRRWFGPRVEAITAFATGVDRVSKRTTVELLRDLFGGRVRHKGVNAYGRASRPRPSGASRRASKPIQAADACEPVPELASPGSERRRASARAHGPRRASSRTSCRFV
ncbi:MAG TPA: DUF6444 domain-containing protein [Polyangiaceae bacterium]|nr:DUF6444 domain-containing protein [Polyangiaceae bacterium]